MLVYGTEGRDGFKVLFKHKKYSNYVIEKPKFNLNSDKLVKINGWLVCSKAVLKDANGWVSGNEWVKKALVREMF